MPASAAAANPNRAAEPRIDIARNRELLLARGGNLVDVFRLVVGLKDLIGLRAKTSLHLPAACASRPADRPEPAGELPV